jgi:hypothetical protein
MSGRWLLLPFSFIAFNVHATAGNAVATKSSEINRTAGAIVVPDMR